ncbi:MAG: hypothetical protein WD227_06430, partial [Vicinamibacterales bacterium]
LAVAAGACSRGDALEIPAGSEVTVQKKDGVTVAGRLVDVKSEHVIVEGRDGVKMTVPRQDIAELRATPPVETDGDRGPSAPADAESPAAVEAAAADPLPRYREVTIPAGTVLPLTLRTSVGSDTSHVEDAVRATLRRGVTVDGVEALPAGTAVTGHVTNADRSARVKGRATVAFRFTRVDVPGEGTANIRTGTVARTAPGTKKKDAAKIGGGAVGGAIVGGILGGGDGAAKGAAVGGAAGTGVVLATRGKEVRLAAGTPISVKLTAPLTVRVAVK